MTEIEHARTFDCFGGRCSIVLSGEGVFGPAPGALDAVQARLRAWHAQFSRFEPDSELCLLNADPRARVAVSPLLARLAQASVDAARASGGLVDATLVDPLERAGYVADWDGQSVPLAEALITAPRRRPAGPAGDAAWKAISVDRTAGTITRPPGVRFDSGGLAKGLFADVLADELGDYTWFLVELCGDLRLGGTAGGRRAVEVDDPFGRGVVHHVRFAAGAAATSGIGRRSFRDADGGPAHHLLDPATGRPAFTGLVQATALAPTALEAERRAKAALLTGPAGARAQLPHGGVLVHDDARVEVVRAPVAPPRLRVSRSAAGLRLSDLEPAR